MSRELLVTGWRLPADMRKLWTLVLSNPAKSELQVRYARYLD
jgi:hypothetical protein